MASADDGYILDAEGNRILIGLTLVETREFERLDQLILSLSPASPDARSRNERRWLMLYDRHEAALLRYLSTENVKALTRHSTGGG